MSTNHSGRKIKRLLLVLTVWAMKLMTRYTGFFARPFIHWYSEQEVIACGLRNGNQVKIIYTPSPKHTGYSLHRQTTKKRMPLIRRQNQTGGRQTVSAEQGRPFSSPLVEQMTLPEAKIGETYIVKTNKIKSGRTIQSPHILIKEKTIDISNFLKILAQSKGHAIISWQPANQFKPMIYFLVIEDENNQSILGLYTRETFWEYPKIKKASLVIGNLNPARLKKYKPYTAKLLLVDFEGWVTHQATKLFIY